MEIETLSSSLGFSRDQLYDLVCTPGLSFGICKNTKTSMMQHLPHKVMVTKEVASAFIHLANTE